MTPSGYRWFAWQDTAVLGPSGEVVEIIGVGRDISVRVQARDALLRSQESLDSMFNAITESACLVERSGLVLMANSTFRDRLNLSLDACLGQDIFSLIPEPLREQRRFHINEMFRTRKPLTFEDERDGRILRHNLYPVLGADGEVERFAIFAMDITERRVASMALKASEERFRRLFEEMNSGFALHEMLFDADGTPKDYRFLAVNPAFEALTGFKAEAIINRTVSEVIPGLERDWIDLYGQVVLTGESNEFEHYLEPMDKWFHALAYRTAPGHFAVLFTDVTARKNVEIALREGEETYRRIYEAVQDPVLVADKESGILLWANLAAERFFGQSREDLVGRHQSTLHPKPEGTAQNEFTEDFKQHAGGCLEAMDVPAIAAGGEVRVVSISTAPAEVHGRKVMVGIFRDVTDRRRLEDTLRESEERFRTFVETANEGVWAMDENFRTTYVNYTMAALLGWRPEDMLGRDVTEFMFPEDLADHSSKMAHRREGASGHYERRFRRKEGGEVWCLVSSSAKMGPEGSFQGSFGMFTDITDRKRMERVLESRIAIGRVANSQDLDAVLQAALDAAEAITLSSIGFFHFVDKDGATLSLQNWSTQTMAHCTTPGKGLHYPIASAGVWVDAVREGRPVIHNDYAALAHKRGLPEGHAPVIRELVVPIYDQGQLVAIVGVGNKPCDYDESDAETLATLAGLAWEVVVRKRAEIALKESEMFLREAQKNASIGYWKANIETDYLLWSDEVNEIIGMPADYKSGLAEGLECYPPEYLPTIREKLSAVLHGGTVEEYECEVLTGSGKRKWVHLNFFAMGQGDGQPTVMGTIQDIDQSKKVALELIRSKEQADAANLAKSEFLANMSHEIRTPLNGVLGMLQLIKDSEISGSVESYAEMGIRAGQRLTNLLADILDLSRIEAGCMPIVSKPFALADIFTALAETFSPLNVSKILSLAIKSTPDVPTEAVGDEVRVRQILFNLVGNAMKFTDKGEVRVEVSTLMPLPSGQVRLLFIVSDTGLGIPDDKVSQICAPFVQAASDFTRSHQGAGLGLSIAKKLIDAMGGTLTFESTEGQGTSVYLTLPVGISEESAIPDAPGSVHDAEAGASLRLLLVEDEEISRLSTRLHLEKLGHQVVTANNGEEAIEALRAGRYDCVLMDIQMDVLDGVAATRAIRSGLSGVLDAQVPIVAMTAYAMEGDRERFLEAGMNDYVAKPLQLEELKKALERIRE